MNEENKNIIMNDDEFENINGGARDDRILYEGIVVGTDGNYHQVKLDDGREIRTFLSGKLRMKLKRVSVDDRVTVELSPYDMNSGRIIEIH